MSMELGLVNRKQNNRSIRRLALSALLLFATSLAAQNPPPPPEQTAPQNPPAGGDVLKSGAVIRNESKLVLVDVIVTDKKGKYIRDLAQSDFKVYEDNKEQHVSSFTAGTSQSAAPNNSQKHYLVLFFDNSSMELPDQISARRAATQFIDANAGPDNLMAVVEFGGSLRILQNFTASADLLKKAASGVKGSNVASNAGATSGPAVADVPGNSFISASAEADYGARTMLLALRTLAKNLRSIPGRKMVVLISAGFPLTPERQSELTATLDACTKANVAIYALDARGLISGALRDDGRRLGVSNRSRAVSNRTTGKATPRLLLASFPEPQRPGGGGGGGGRPGGGGTGGTGGAGGTGGTGGTGGRGGTGGTGGTGGRGGTGGTGGTGTRGGSGGGGTGVRPSSFNNPNNPLSQPRSIVPPLPPSGVPNQQILAALAEGTGGFTIFNTNDLLGGLQRIASEMNEFYLLGYVPPDTPEGSCHTLKVKVARGGTNVRARTGYCNSRSSNALEGTPVEKQLELRAQGAAAAANASAFQAPYFYSAANVARVNLAMDIPGQSFHFEKEKGKYHADLSVLGIAYKPDGSIGAKFSDQVKLDLEKDEWKEFSKTPFHYANQFDAAPGAYKMTVVLNSGGDAYAKSEFPMKIEDYDGKRLSLGSVVISSSVQRVEEIAKNADLDAALLEDQTPLVVKGMEIKPIATNHFKKTDHVVMYSEIYDSQLLGETPSKLRFGYTIEDRATNQQIVSTGAIAADDFVQKGSPVVPVGLLVKVSDLKPGQYRLILMAADATGHNAPNRTADFDVTE